MRTFILCALVACAVAEQYGGGYEPKSDSKSQQFYEPDKQYGYDGGFGHSKSSGDYGYGGYSGSKSSNDYGYGGYSSSKSSNDYGYGGYSGSTSSDDYGYGGYSDSKSSSDDYGYGGHGNSKSSDKYGYGGHGDSKSVDQYGYGKISPAKHDAYYAPKQKKCFQCAYTSPKTTTKDVKVPHHIRKKVHVDKGYGRYGYEYVTEKVYKTKTVSQTTNGGWDKCLKPFTFWQAKDWGIDEWDCEGNCYVRKEANGDLYRGCFGGEFGVDQTWLGCNEQKGATWCFCEGDRCNNKIKIH